MIKEMIVDDLTFLDLDVDNSDELFEFITKEANKLGYVKLEFLSAIKKREKEYPTALPIEPMPIAIPHSDPINVNKQFIATIRLKKAIKWEEMANNGNYLDVQLVFLLGFKKEEKHVEVLQLLMDKFQNIKTIDSLMKAKNKQEFLNIIKSFE